MTVRSVLDKARALTAEANKLREGAEAEENAKRVLTQVDELAGLLQRLVRRIEATRKLRERGVDVQLGSVDDGREAFARLAAGGLPSLQAFAPARRKIEAVVDRVEATLTQAWTQWTGQRLAALPVQRLAMLSTSEQRAESSSLADLKTLAKIQNPGPGDVVQFAVLHASLAEVLDRLPEPVAELEELLRRLAQRVPLDEVTDAEIALLRQYGIGDQVELHRRGL